MFLALLSSLLVNLSHDAFCPLSAESGHALDSLELLRECVDHRSSFAKQRSAFLGGWAPSPGRI